MLQCGFYEKEITPPLGSDIPGYFMKRPSTGVLRLPGAHLRDDRLYTAAGSVKKIHDRHSLRRQLICKCAAGNPCLNAVLDLILHQKVPDCISGKSL